MCSGYDVSCCFEVDVQLVSICLCEIDYYKQAPSYLVKPFMEAKNS